MALSFDNSEKFINPYNFVSKTDTVFRAKPARENLTGTIHCKIIVKDKLAMPDSENRENFFNINGEPVIPGSELRGCIRSVYEAVTPSCFSVVNTRTLHQRFGRPTADSGIFPAILKQGNDGKMHFYDAEKVSSKDDYEIERKWMNLRARRIVTTYYRVISDYADEPIDCYDSDIEDLLFIVDEYLNNENDQRFRKIIEETKSNIENKKPVLVFYRLEDGDITYLSVAQFSRHVFKNTVPDLLGDHRPCGGNDKKYCPACLLFGTLGEATKSPLASRVRFGDAILEIPKEEALAEKAEWLPELSSPKITSIEFYSLNDINQKPNFNDAVKWNYDSPGIRLRGRKFYFHSKVKPEYEPIDDNEAKRRIKTRVIETKKEAKSPTSFRFDLFFDEISETELKNLLWVLTLGENEEDGHFLHKIGMGRPVGFGSVKIVVTGIEERELDISLDPANESDYSISNKKFVDYDFTESKYLNAPDAIQFNTTAVNDLMKISDYNLLLNSKAEVSYPKADNGKNDSNAIAHHQWFTTNRTPRGTFAYPLPKLSSNDLSLPAAKAANRIGSPARNRYNFVHNISPNNVQSSEAGSNKQHPKQNIQQSNSETIKGKKCPNCGKFNFRLKKDSNEVSKNWKQGICYNCKASLMNDD